MFRKKRFKRWTLGKLSNFMKKRAYTGKIYYSKLLQNTAVTFILNNQKTECKHY